MQIWQLGIILAVIVSGLIGLIWWGVKKSKNPNKVDANIEKSALEDVNRIFNDEFRQELRNRGRLHFEKIIGENAMFLQQDLRLTTSQLNDYMKQEIKRVLEDEFSKYEESISGAKQMAIESIQKTQSAIEQQREALEKQLLEEVAAEKARIINKFEANMADIINHYILTAVSNEIDLSEQIDYIYQYLEENKQSILEDIKHGS